MLDWARVSAGVCMNHFVETGLVVLITPLLSYFLWKLTKWINRGVQWLLPEGKLKRGLNTYMYQGLGEVVSADPARGAARVTEAQS